MLTAQLQNEDVIQCNVDLKLLTGFVYSNLKMFALLNVWNYFSLNVQFDILRQRLQKQAIQNSCSLWGFVSNTYTHLNVRFLLRVIA